MRSPWRVGVVTFSLLVPLVGCSDDDVTFAKRLIQDPGIAAVPGSSFFSRPELGRSKLRFAFPKRLETLEAAAERINRIATPA